jgi:SAM-dependent methyltransferase
MANFPPLKNCIFFYLDQIIDKYGLCSPFLDVGCGIGDVSQYVASKGLHGKAIDFSDIAIQTARQNLVYNSNIKIEKKSLFQETMTYKTIFLMDVLEHIENDNAALEKISSLLVRNGHVIITIPTNPIEWRWDDHFYGHFRRYTVEDISKQLINVGLEPILFWDFTYPFFWILRRVYTKLKSSPKNIESDKLKLTQKSSTVNSWNIPFLSFILSHNHYIWRLIYKMQFTYFKEKVENGHEMMVLAKKK